jgi:hypothetical protein
MIISAFVLTQFMHPREASIIVCRLLDLKDLTPILGHVLYPDHPTYVILYPTCRACSLSPTTPYSLFTTGTRLYFTTGFGTKQRRVDGDGWGHHLQF